MPNPAAVNGLSLIDRAEGTLLSWLVLTPAIAVAIWSDVGVTPAGKQRKIFANIAGVIVIVIVDLDPDIEVDMDDAMKLTCSSAWVARTSSAIWPPRRSRPDRPTPIVNSTAIAARIMIPLGTCPPAKRCADTASSPLAVANTPARADRGSQPRASIGATAAIGSVIVADPALTDTNRQR